MKLSSKIISGFVLTNLIYVLLLAIIFVFVRPVQTNSEALLQFILPVSEAASGINRNIGELPSNMRAFAVSPSLDQAPLNIFNDLVKEIDADVANIGKILSDPKAAFLQTQSLTSAFRDFNSLYKQYLDLANITPDRLHKVVSLRNDMVAAYYEAVSSIKEVLKIEEGTYEMEIRAGDLAAIKNRADRIAAIHHILDNFSESFVVFVRGILRHDQSLYDQSLAVLAETIQFLRNLISTTSVPAHKAALESAQKVTTGRFESSVRAIMTSMDENDALTRKREALAYAAMEEGVKLNSEVEEVTRSFARGMGSAVTTVVAAMAGGALVALVISMALAVMLTRGIVGPINQIINSLSESANEVDGASSQLTGASTPWPKGPRKTRPAWRRPARLWRNSVP
jgi:hypothetical protein